MKSYPFIQRLILAMILTLMPAMSLISKAGETLPVKPCNSCSSYTPGYIALPADWAADPALTLAASKLADIMAALYGNKPAVSSDSDVQLSDNTEGIVIVGKNNSLIEKLGIAAMLSEKPVPPEAYSITAVKIGDRPVLLVEGGDELGCAYALFYIVERLLIEPQNITTLNTFRKPAFALRIASGDSPQQALALGYNTIATESDYNETLYLTNYDPKAFNDHHIAKINIAERRKTFAAELDTAKKLHLRTVSMSTEFKFNKIIKNRPWAKKILGDNKRCGVICSCTDEIKTIMAAKYAELNTAFPTLDYAAVQTVDVFPTGEYFGNTPTPRDSFQNCIECSLDLYSERVASFIDTMSQSVAATDSPRIYIHRAWDGRSDSFHARQDYYNDISSKAAKNSNILISLKYTKTDFWQYNFPNPNIGAGKVPQIIEYQCPRKYEGAGAFPAYNGQELAVAYLYSAERGIGGAWNLHSIESGAPSIKTGLWNQANIYAAAHLAWDPAASPETLAKEWAAITFGRAAANDIAKILLISEDAARKLFYFEAYASKKGSPMLPNEGWISPEGDIRGADRLKIIYTAAPEAIGAIIKEKTDAIVQIEKMLNIASSLPLDKKSAQPVTDTIKSQLLLARVLRSYLAAYMYHCRWLENNSYNDHALAALNAEEWKNNWVNYTEEIPNLRWASNIFRDGGMVKTMNGILKDLGRM